MKWMIIYAAGALSALSQQCIESGINLESISYYSHINPFINMAKLSEEWRRPKESSKAYVPLSLTEDRYVKELEGDGDHAVSIVSVKFQNHSFGERRYTLLFDGDGDIEFHYVKPKIISRGENRIDVEFDEKVGALALRIDAVKSDDPIRNIRLVPTKKISDLSDKVYNEDFKDLIRPFSVVRLMDFNVTNNNKQSAWEDRPTVSQYGRNAVALEDMVALANELKVRPWFNIPHLADDRYVRQMADYVAANLDPELSVFVEYSNEVWNHSFEQARWASKQAERQGISPEKFYVLKSARVLSIWRSAFNDDTSRVKGVLGAQLGNSWRTEQMLKSVDDPDSTFDVLAVNYYLGGIVGSPEMAERTLKLGNAELFEYLETIELPKLRVALRDQKKLAKKHGMELVAYEAGQHLVGHGASDALGGYLPDNAELTSKLIGLNQDARIAELYDKMIDVWLEEGGGLINWFRLTGNNGKWGSWGMVNVKDSSAAGSPKYHSVLKRTCAR